MDVVSAFLNGQIDTTIYLTQPEGFSFGIGMVCILHKSIYGLCQVARIWYNVLHDALVEIGFNRLVADLACWFKITRLAIIFVIAHVDDILSIGLQDDVLETKEHLKKKFKTKDMGEGQLFIGLNLIRDKEKGLIFVDQSHYTKEVLETYGMAECNPAATPLLLGESLVKGSDTDLLPPGDKKIYQVLVGSLGYLMNCSWPDMAYAVTRLTQFAAFPTKAHLTAAKHVLRYLKATQNVHLTLGGSAGVDENDHHILSVYFDSSWADYKDDSRSTFGYVLLYGTSPLLWKSKKHKSVSLSSTDAEYLAATETTREICWVLNLFKGLQLEVALPIPLLGDNENANGLASGMTSNNRTPHIDLRQRYVTEKSAEGLIKVMWVPTIDQAADIFTKSLSRPTITHLCNKIGVILPPSSHTCLTCRTPFNSNNAMHKHIREVHMSGMLLQRFCSYPLICASYITREPLCTGHTVAYVHWSYGSLCAPVLQ